MNGTFERGVFVKGVVLLVLVSVALLGGGCGDSWRGRLDSQLPVLGHRNWIVVADSAYPAQSRAGIETVATGAGQIEVVRAVLEAVDAAGHVRAKVYLDAELNHVPEDEAAGIDAYRKELAALLDGRKVKSVPHDELIGKLDAAAKTFNVLIFKTDLTLPYTSVFLELDCGYWGPAEEAKLRKAISRNK